MPGDTYLTSNNGTAQVPVLLIPIGSPSDRRHSYNKNRCHRPRSQRYKNVFTMAEPNNLTFNKDKVKAAFDLSSFEMNAVLRGAQLTIVGGTSLLFRCSISSFIHPIPSTTFVGFIKTRSRLDILSIYAWISIYIYIYIYIHIYLCVPGLTRHAVAHRALQNPAIFNNAHYKQAAVAIGAGLAIRLAIAVPVCCVWPCTSSSTNRHHPHSPGYRC